MELRTKILVIICVIFGIILTGFIAYSLQTLQKSYEDVEWHQLGEDLQRVNFTLSTELADLDSRLVDWSEWDDTYRFVVGDNTEYVADNLMEDTFRTLDLNLVLIFNRSGELVYSQAYNQSTGSLEPVAPEFLKGVNPGNQNLFSHLEEPVTSKTGLIAYGSYQALIAIHPIRKSSGEGPSEGFMIMGRYLDPDRIARIEQLTGVGIILLGPPGGAPGMENLLTREGIVSGQINIIPINTSFIEAYEGYPALDGASYILGIQEPRTIFQGGISTISSFIAIVVFLSLIVGTLGVFGLDRLYFSRISTITSEVRKVPKASDAIRIAEVPGNDELSDLSRAINGMLDEISRTHQMIRESELRYRSVVEDQTEYICRFLPGGKVTFMNPAFERHFFDVQGLNRDISIFEMNPPELWRHIQEFAATLSLNSPIGSDELNYRNGEEEYWISWTLRARFVEDESVSEYQFVGRDISSEKKALIALQHYRDNLEDLVQKRTESLIAAQQELEKADRLESLGLLAGGIAHDFNNLLLTIRGNIEILKLEAGAGSPICSRLQGMEKVVLRASDLTNQMLTFGRGGAPIKKITDIPGIVRETAGFACRGSNVKCHISENPVTIKAAVDPAQIRQALTNIILNALQAEPRGGTVEIGIEDREIGEGESNFVTTGHYVAISVTDHGQGIAPEHRGLIFEPFFSTKSQGKGLGLPISFSIVKKHGGHIYVRSEQGKGSTFEILIPMTIGPPTEVTVPGSPPPDKSAARVTGERILVMDDEEAIRDLLSQMLRRKGFDVITAGEGNEAYNLYKKAKESEMPFDLVIMDLTIPGGLGGKETIDIIRRFDPKVRAIVSSGYSNDPIMADYSKYGFSGVLPKPFSLSDLYDLVVKTMQNKDEGE